MPNETIVLSIEDIVIRVLSHRITAFPDTGTIASIAKGAPRAVVTPGLFGTLKFSILNSRLYTVTLNVIPGSTDDAWLFAAAELQTITHSPLSFSAVHDTSKWISAACMIMEDPEVTWSADGTEVNAWPITGNFTGVKMGSFVNPVTLTTDQVDAAL